MSGKNKRFGIHEVKEGEFKDCLHVATKSYQKFKCELGYLCDYLNRRVLPKQPEEQLMSQTLLSLQNILEYESEELIRHYIKNNQTKRNLKFEKEMKNGFVSFKSKFEWLKKKFLITQDEYNIMDEIRLLRNSHIHVRPSHRRSRHKYFKKPLLTIKSLRRMFMDVEKVLKNLRRESGNKLKWGILPAGYASEMKWSKEAIALFDKK